MGNAQKALVMAAGIFLAIALITIAVVLFVSAQEATKTAQSSFSNIQTELSRTAFTVYDGTEVSGSQVVNAVRKFSTQDDFGVKVITGKNSTGLYYGRIFDSKGEIAGNPAGNNTSPSEWLQQNGLLESSINYVNPSGKFKSKLVIDPNNMVRGIEFSQK